MNVFVFPLALCVLAMAITGCSDSKSLAPATAPSKPATSAPAQLVLGEAADSPPADAPAGGENTGAVVVAPEAEQEFRDEPGSINRAEALNLLVDDFKSQQGRYPNDLKELVSAKLIPRLPSAPVGKKFTLNNESRVVVVDQ